MPFSGFCHTPLWDQNVTWYTNNPHFTTCLEDTVLTWVPFMVLVIAFPFKMANSFGPRMTPYPMTLLLYAKYAATCYLGLVFGTALYADSSGETSLAEMTAAVINMMGCAISLMYQVIEQRRAYRTSDTLFLYWLLSAVCSFPAYYRVIRNTFSSLSDEVPSAFHYTINMITFPITCGLVVFYSFTERHPSDTKKVCPLDIASLISAISFEWFTPMIVAGFWKTLKVTDLFEVSEELKTHHNYSRWMASNKDGVEGRRLLRSIAATFWPTLLFSVALQGIFGFFRTLPPVLLTLVISFVSSKEETWKGYFYGVAIFVAGKTGMTLLRHCDFHYVLMGLQIKGVLISAIYQKTLRISNASLSKYTVGEIVNLMTVDADKVYQASLFIGQGVGAMYMVLMVTMWLWLFVGASALAVIGATFFVFPVTVILTKIGDKYHKKLMSLKDNRLMNSSEALGNIRILKFYAWEVPFMQQILNIRNEEISTLRLYAKLAAFMRFFWFTLPFLQSLMVFSIYMLTKGLTTLDVQAGFLVITLCNMVRMPLAACPDVISSLIQTSVALNRIASFLDAGEKDMSIIGDNAGDGNAIRIKDASFSWSVKPGNPPFLKDINLTVETGQLVGVFGLVGSGKSSLLNALLGEMSIMEGTVNISGSVAYVPQRAWILHGTIRSNIIFMSDFEKYYYKKVADKCCLKSDFDMLMDGDRTEIGEKGVNLSGGQRQRISLARAVYLDKDVYLLDDPLSAVDAQVGSIIFNKVIGPRGLLREKTRLFVTNNLSLLSAVDTIVFLQDGKIADFGSFTELMAKRGAFADVVTEYSKHPESEERRDSGGHMGRILSMSDSGAETSVTVTVATKGNILICDEAIQEGSIKKEVYINYAKHVGAVILTAALCGYVGCRIFDVGSGLWIGSWSRDSELPKAEQTASRRTLRIVVFFVIGSFMGLFAFLGTSMLNIGAIKASKHLHECMIRCMFQAPMSFFDTTPLGRILNRVGKDVDQLDIQLPLMTNIFFELFFQLIAMCFLISVVLPLFLAAAVPLTILYWLMQKVYLKTLRQLKRLESVTRSPVVATFAETLDGLSSIRSYNAQRLFMDRFLTDVDRTQNCSFFLLTSKLWLISRLDLIGGFLVLTTAFLIVSWRETITPGTAGLMLSYIITSTFAFNNLVHYAAESEAAIVSSERVEEYSKIESEAPRHLEPRPASDWPQKGVITFVNFSARYREGLRLCIRDVNMEFHAAEKVAIVGRTGAGKSTLTLALFRIIEASKGSIFIDNQDISKVGLHDLRSKLTIIPQDAILFSGTLRMNLDPDGQYDDSALWNVLEITNLKGRFPDGLKTTISEGGTNISVGQRQLVCLARAVLKSTKILILDEATAAVDVETDALIQKTIRTVFAESTVLTIAHRLHTILDSDRIVVMADGEVIEMGSPADLLADSKTEFHAMARESGIV